MSVKSIMVKAERGEGLTVEEVKVYQANAKHEKQVYGKWGNIKKQYLEKIGIDWTITNLPEYLHGVDKAADELYETMYAKLSQDERYKRTGNYLEDVRRENQIKALIDEEIYNEIIYTE